MAVPPPRHWDISCSFEESRNKQIQKRQIKKQYAKETRERLKETAQKVWVTTKETTRKTASFVVKHWKIIAVILLILLVLTILFSALTSVLAVFSSSFSSVVGSTYISADNEIISAENKYIQLEEDLQREIDNVENTYGGYDEYVYDIDEIKHDPYILTSILSAMYLEYSVEDIQNTEKLFEDIKHIDENNNEYWLARELQQVLEYKEWRNFKIVIDKAIIACENSKNCKEKNY